MRVVSGQLGRSNQKLLKVPAGTTLGLSTADTADDLLTDLPQIIAVTAIGTISSIAQTIFRNNEIGVALQRIFGQWLNFLESLTGDGPTWHLIEGPIELPFTAYNPLQGVGDEQSVLGLGRVIL